MVMESLVVLAFFGQAERVGEGFGETFLLCEEVSSFGIELQRIKRVRKAQPESSILLASGSRSRTMGKVSLPTVERPCWRRKGLTRCA